LFTPLHDATPLTLHFHILKKSSCVLSRDYRRHDPCIPCTLPEEQNRRTAAAAAAARDPRSSMLLSPEHAAYVQYVPATPYGYAHVYEQGHPAYRGLPASMLLHGYQGIVMPAAIWSFSMSHVSL